jgi:DNA-binding CsgD family transcriptional regulator
MADDWRLRPVERRMRRLVHQGVPDTEIARRFRRSPEFVRRVLAMSELDRMPAPPDASPLRPIERRILRWRAAGRGASDIASMFRRSPQFVERVEDLARYKLAR